MPKRTTETSTTTETSRATDNSLNDGNGFWDELELEPLIDGEGTILTKAPTKAPTIEEKPVSEKKVSEESAPQTAQDKSDIEAKIPTSKLSNDTTNTPVWAGWKKSPSKKDQMITNNRFVDNKTKYFLWSKKKKQELIDLAKITLLTEKKRKR